MMKEGEGLSTPLKESPMGSAQPEQVVTPETAQEKESVQFDELLKKTSQGQAVVSDDAAITLDAKHIGAMTDEESKVQKLLDLASTKGVTHAVQVARSLKDYYALDRMHDELNGKLYEGLVARGLIEKE